MKNLNVFDMKVTLIGLGAMGVFFAPALEAVIGRDNFRVIAEGDRKKRLENQGVTINGTCYKFNIIEPKDNLEKADLIIIAVKDTGLEQAIKDIALQVGENTQILCVMNGIDSEEKIAQVYGWDHVLYSYMRVSIAMDNGVANFDPTWGMIHFGEKVNQEHAYSDRVKAIAQLFDAAHIRYRIEKDMIRGMWYKFMCNIGENLTCALLGIPYGVFHTNENANAIRRMAMEEVVAIAQALGVDLSHDDIEHQEETIKIIPAQNKPSTLQDLEKGLKTEIDMFAGKVLKMGQELGIETPLNFMFYHGIKVREQLGLRE